MAGRAPGSILAEPLVWFGIVAALAWAVAPDAVPPPRWGAPVPPVQDATIVVDDHVRAELRADLAATRGRAPTAVEEALAVERWIEEEMLVREARRTGLDVGDATVRRHLAERMAFLLDATVSQTPPDEAVLRAWYAQDAEAFERPARWTLRQLFTTAGADHAAALLRRVAAGDDPVTLAEVGEPPPGGPVLRRRTAARLRELFGDAFVDGLTPLREGDAAVLRSRDGWHAAWVERIDGGGPVPFEEALPRLRLRWEAQAADDARVRALESLATRYEVEGWP